MKIPFGEERLTSGDRALRLCLLSGLFVVAAALRIISPGTFSWLPFRTSCGAMTGLPCIFCGTTRALHHLLNGEWRTALYFNWIALPVAFIAAVFAFKLALEIFAGSAVRIPLPPLHVTRRSAALAFGALFMLWLLQVSLAVSLHKRELLNPDGLLYGLVVK